MLLGGSELFLGRCFVDDRVLEVWAQELGCKAFLKFPQLPLNFQRVSPIPWSFAKSQKDSAT